MPGAVTSPSGQLHELSTPAGGGCLVTSNLVEDRKMDEDARVIVAYER